MNFFKNIFPFGSDHFILKRLPSPGHIEKLYNEKTNEVFYLLNQKDVELTIDENKVVTDIKLIK